MSFKLKVLLANIILMAVSLGLLGFLLIHNSYSVSFDMQLEGGMEQHQIIVSAVQAVAMKLLVNDQFQSISQLKEMGDEIADTVAGTGAKFCLLDENRNILYVNSEEVSYSDEVLDYLEKGKRNYMIEDQNGKQLLTIASIVQVKDSLIYIVNQRDISSIYQQNDRQIRFFEITMVIAIVCCSLIIFAITVWLTKPIEQLNQAASVITSGDYSVRTEVKSNDEIGELSEKFDAMTEAIEKHVQELQNQARQQEDFVASFTHEIKTPMTAVIGYADMLRSKEMEEEQKILTANYIFHEGKRLEQMSLKLFDLIALGRNEIEMKEIYTKVLEEEIEEIAHPILERARLQLRHSMEPAMLMGDRDLIKTLLINLIDNARKASEEDGIVELLGFFNENGMYEIQVKDYGCGIPEDEISKICEAFYMVDKSRSRKQGGAGLGLATASRIIEAHHGRFLVESTIGQGTIMRVILQASEEDAMDESDEIEVRDEIEISDDIEACEEIEVSDDIDESKDING